ncbi:MAG: Ig-like domain-containing protein, partial [Acidimicrobiia bacterium]|nr:Ig-like domain-containing protein [Acidimicrobiia bacterium]
WTPTEAQGPGPFTFDVVVTDNGTPTLSDSETITVTVGELNDNLPIPADDGPFAVSEGGTLTIVAPGVVSNDTDGDIPANTLTPTVTASPLHASLLILNADGSFTYVHDGTENFTDSFAYELNDGANTSLFSAVVSITITPANDNAPVAGDDSYGGVAEGASLTVLAGAGVLANDSDVDLPADTLAANLLADVSHGTLSLAADGGFLYIHDGSENFADSFTYEVSDGTLTSAPATVSLTIDPINDNAPTVPPSSYTVDEGATLSPAAAGGVLAAAFDADGDPVSASLASPPVAGTLSLAGDGSFIYTHDGSETFSDSFTFIATDGTNDGSPVAVTITIAPIDEPPVATSPVFPVIEDLPVGTTIGAIPASDPEGLPLSFSLVGGDLLGQFTIDPITGDLILVSPLDFDVTPGYLLDVVVSDPGGNTAPASVIVVVTAAADLPSINLAPIGLVDTIFLDEDTSTLVAPLSNDSDPDGDALFVSWIDAPINGTLTSNGDGTFTYQPAADFNGTESLSYGISDGRGGTDVASVVLDIRAVNDLPVTPSIEVDLEFAPELTIPIPAGVIDPDGDAYDITVGPPDNGTVGLTPGGFRYVPVPEWNGTDTFTYVVTDSNGGSSTGIVTVRVTQLDGQLVSIDLVSVEDVEPPASSGSSGIVVDSIKLLVGTVAEMSLLLSIPLLAVGAVFLASIVFGLSRNFLIGRGPVFLPTRAPGMVAVVRAPAGAVVTALEGPGDEYPVVHRYQPAASGIRATGRRAQRNADIWVEVETPDGDAWVIDRFVTQQVPAGSLVSDEDVSDLLQDLVDVVEARGTLTPLVTGYGLEVAFYASPKRMSGEELASLLEKDASWGWWDPTGTSPTVRGEFFNVVADPLATAIRSIEARSVAEAVVEIPVELVNFPSLTFSLPDQLGWRVFLDFEEDVPKLAAIWREGQTNPAAV